MAATPSSLARPLSQASAFLLVPALLVACSRQPSVTRPSDGTVTSAQRAVAPPASGPPGPTSQSSKAASDLRAARALVACKAEAPRGRALVLDPRDENAGCRLVLNDGVRAALLAAAFPEGRASCARLSCEEPAKQAGTTAVSSLDEASAVRGAFTAPGRDQIVWAVVAQAEGLPASFALTTMFVTEGDAVVARAEPEDLSHGTLALVKTLDVNGDGVDELVTRTSSSWMGEGHVEAALVGARAGKLSELHKFAGLLVEYAGADARSESDVATRVFLRPASAATPAAFELEAFARGCRPSDAPSVRPTAKPCTGGAADWRRTGSTTQTLPTR
jgi:hypothetical protein